MTTDQLYEYMKKPMLLSDKTLEDVHQLLAAYPYSSTCAFLYLYNLAAVKDVRYASELQRLAPMLPNRDKLFRLVEGYSHTHELDDHNKKEEDSFALIEDFLDEMKSSGVDLPDELVYTSAQSIPDYFNDAALEESQDGKDDLNLLGIRTEKDKKEDEEPGNISTKSEEIEKTDPGCPSDSDDESNDIIDNNLEESMFTETLAKIYIKQGRFDKALRIIHSLNLNFPEKSPYFADQIRFLEKISKNNKQE